MSNCHVKDGSGKGAVRDSGMHANADSQQMPCLPELPSDAVSEMFRSSNLTGACGVFF